MEIFGPKKNVPGINGLAIKHKTSGENAEKPATRAMQGKLKDIVSFTSSYLLQNVQLSSIITASSYLYVISVIIVGN